MREFRKIALTGMVATAAAFAVGEYDFSDNVAAKQVPPGGIPVEKAPMFITLGVDDIDRSGDYKDDLAIGKMGTRYLIDYFENKKNPNGQGNSATFDGSPTRISFYVTSVYLSASGADNPNLIKRILHEAWQKGFEVGNHSQTHGDPIKNGTKEYLMEKEIEVCNDWLSKPVPPKSIPDYELTPDHGAGIPLEEITGWRTPFLAYGNDLLPALKEVGIMYDCSIEEGNDTENQDGTNFRWPYTLDNSSPGHYEGWSGNDENPNKIDVPKVSGLWELPNHVAMLPPDDKCSEYGLDYSLRQKMYDLITAKAPTQQWFKEDTDRFTNFDYNFWHQFGLSGADVTAILKYTLDLRMQGNRAPLMIGAHDGWFHKAKDGNGVNAGWQERQKAYADFFEYALQKYPEVRIVTGQNIIDWCRNPIALDDIHYRVTSEVVNDTIEDFTNKDGLPEWDAQTAFEQNGMLVFHNGHKWILKNWYSQGVEPGTNDEHWDDNGAAGGVDVVKGGSISFEGDTLIQKGGTFSVTFNPESGKKVVGLWINGTYTDPENSVSLTSLDKNSTIKVKYGSGPISVVANKTTVTNAIATSLTSKGVQLSVPQQGEYAVSLFTANGRLIDTHKSLFQKGIHGIDFNLNELANTMLLVRVESANASTVKRLVVR